MILIKAPNLLPAGFEMAGAFSILLTSAYQFTQVDAKTDEQSFFFKGFPSVWNFLVHLHDVVGVKSLDQSDCSGGL